jgi:hypothetical protein
MPDDDWQPWSRRLGAPRIFGGRRSHRRRRTLALSLPAAVLIGVVVLLAGAAAVVYRDRPAQQVDRPPRPADAGSLVPPDSWLGPPLTGSDTPASSTAPAPGQPAPTEATAAGLTGAILQVTRDAVPGIVDLAAEGTKDWVHWADRDVWSLERRRDGGFAILEGTPSARRERHEGSPEQFRWAGGDPVAESSGSRSGVRTCGAGSGFTLSAPAAKETRVLRIYVGVWQAKGKLTARLPGGADPVVLDLDAPDAVRTAVYRLTFRAEQGGRLEITWNTEQAYGPDCAGVALQAATLR